MSEPAILQDSSSRFTTLSLGLGLASTPGHFSIAPLPICDLPRTTVTDAFERGRALSILSRGLMETPGHSVIPAPSTLDNPGSVTAGDFFRAIGDSIHRLFRGFAEH